MTVASTAVPVQYAGNGVTTTFAFSYFFTAQSDLVVYLTDSSTPPVITKKTLVTDYTITGTQAANGTYPNGGSVVFGTPPPTGTTVTILSDPPETQSTHWVDNDPDPAAVKELAFDKLTLLVQRVKALIAGAMTLPDGFVGSFSPLLPSGMTQNPGATLVINVDGDGFDIGPDVSDAAADAAAAAASATAAAGSATSASGSATAAATSATSAAASATSAASSATAAAASAASFNGVTGSFASPQLVANGAQIPVISGNLRQKIYVKGSGGAVICGTPFIAAGTIDGQSLEVQCVDSTNTVTIPDGAGTGTRSNGDALLQQDSIISYRWDTNKWVEVSRNGI